MRHFERLTNNTAPHPAPKPGCFPPPPGQSFFPPPPGQSFFPAFAAASAAAFSRASASVTSPSPTAITAPPIASEAVGMYPATNTLHGPLRQCHAG